MLPRETLGRSTFELAVSLMKWLPLKMVDRVLLALSWMTLGNIEKLGIKRPSQGPLELKNTQGKTPVLDIGALSKIKSGEIKVVPGVKRFLHGKAELVDHTIIDVDSVILATGYRSNVHSWLQVNQTSFFFLPCGVILVRGDQSGSHFCSSPNSFVTISLKRTCNSMCFCMAFHMI